LCVDSFQLIIAASENVEAAKSAGFDIKKFFSDGGIFMWALLLCSIVAATAVVYKVISLASSAIINTDVEKAVIDFNNEQSDANADAIDLAINSHKSELSQLCVTALANHESSREDLSQIVQTSARDTVVRLQAGMGVLEVIITIAPLIGLLGTVSGLVNVFNSLDIASSDNLEVGKGIAQALNTTIGGLVVAVPAVIANTYFTRRIETFATRLEVLMGGFISAMKKS